MSPEIPMSILWLCTGAVNESIGNISSSEPQELMGPTDQLPSI